VEVDGVVLLVYYLQSGKIAENKMLGRIGYIL